MQTTAELREGFLSFFEEKGHLRRPSASVIPPPDDPSTLFIIAGMQPMSRWFLGLEEPPSRRITTVQKVMRAGGKQNDLDDVGRTNRHLSFYEMLGNFSFGDYFKDGAIDLAWEFVVDRMKLDPERLWASVFAGDPELELGEDEVAIAGWQRVGMAREHIVGLPRAENFWQGAETGLCGPCSELHYDRGEKYGCDRPACGPGCDCDRYLELWNLVFMQYDLGADGKLTPLPQENIDTGLGLERGAMVLQATDSIFDTDAYEPMMRWISEHAEASYEDSDEIRKAYRVVAEHSRAMTFLAAEGVVPSNEGRGYVLRRVIRRAVQHARRIGIGSIAGLPPVVIEQLGDLYPELREHGSEAEQIVRAEEERFGETLERGLKLFEEIAAREQISGADAFKLHDTYGFPLELTRELALERGLTIDEEEFTRLMAEQRERSRSGSGKEDLRAAEFVKKAGFRTDFVGFERTDVYTQIGAIEDLGDGTFLAKLRESPFYPDGGGQVSDTGYVELDAGSARAELLEAYRFVDDQALLFEGSGFKAGDRVHAVVPWSVRFPTMANHTGTHLLHKALRDVLGEHVRQAGSAVRPDKLRFDFTHPQALSDDERHRVEHAVNEVIFQNRPVRAYVTTQDEARNLGAMMLFGEKYGDEVRVVEVDGYSRELCGGTHVRSTAEIGSLAILSEGSVGSGARRIEAVTSGEAFAFLHERAAEAGELRAELEQTKKEARKKPAKDQGLELEARSEAEIGGVNIYVGRIGNVDMDVLLAESDRIKQERSPAAVVLGSSENGTVHLVANFDKGLEDRVNAVEVIRAAAAEVGGGGGGRPTMARAGGKDPAKLDDALAKAEEALRNALA